MTGLTINAEPILNKEQVIAWEKANQQKAIDEVEALILQGKLTKEQIAKWREDNPEPKKTTK